MTRTVPIEGSTLGRSVAIRFARGTFDVLSSHLRQDPHREQFAFCLFSRDKTSDGTTLIVRDLLLPEEGDLAEQSGGGVSPSKTFQATAYLLAEQSRLGIMDVHTHLSRGVPRFSGTDHTESAKNARYISERFDYPITHVMVVFDRSAKAHDAVIYDRSLGAHREIDRIEILGRKIDILPTRRDEGSRDQDDPRYSRQTMIPGWDQQTISRQRIAVVGAGGNGAHVLQALVSIGAGTEGWIAGIDPDLIEHSNLPRIPYAQPGDVGQPKVTIAARYAGQKNPEVRFYPYPCSVTERAAINQIKASSVIIGAGDGDGLRKVCSELSVRYLIPYIDLGCDIQVDGTSVEAGGQVRVSVPGSNACLVCSGGYDPAVAAIELMDDKAAAVHAARGYVRGGRQEATPSVANLNATIAQLGITAFLALVHGERFGSWDYAYYNQLTAETLTAVTARRDDCPLCGPAGVMALGDDQPCRQDAAPTARQEALRDGV